MHNLLMKSSTRLAAQVIPLKNFLMLAGISLPVFAFQPLITDDTGTQGVGGNQLELSFNEDRAKLAGNTDRIRSLPVAYTRGLTDTIDIFAGISYARIHAGTSGDSSSGAGNPAIGGKWRFYENGESKTSFAVKPEILFPVSSDRESGGLGTGKTSGNLTFILTQEVPFGAIHLNAGLGRDRFRDTLINPDLTKTRVSIAPVWDVTEQWKLALDLGTESARAGGTGVRSDFVELGAIYSPNKDLDFAVGFIHSADNDSPRTTTDTATAGITWRFK
ncbi:transporter [Propionivibrio sp.]|uniref:transporter n=1 Tax=Propionivibrio sp. TaxID=2212460 RepID=UPI003BF23682